MPVIHGPRRPKGRPAVAHGLEQCPFSHHVEVGFLLPGKGSFWQVFRVGRGAHRHGNVLTQGRIGFAQCCFYRPRQRSHGKQAGDFSGLGIKRNGLFHQPRFGKLEELVPQMVVGDELPIGRRCQVKSGRHGKTGPEQPRQRPPFAADRIEIGGGVEVKDITHLKTAPFVLASARSAWAASRPVDIAVALCLWVSWGSSAGCASRSVAGESAHPCVRGTAHDAFSSSWHRMDTGTSSMNPLLPLIPKPRMPWFALCIPPQKTGSW